MHGKYTIPVDGTTFDGKISNLSIKDNSHNLTISNTVNVLDHVIQGQMLTATLSLSPHEASMLDDLEIKNRLITQLVREMMDGKFIEFTKQNDPMSMGVMVRARIFVTPDNNVRLIRQMQK